MQRRPVTATRGFTLLELLVVLVIVGILVVMTTLSVGVSGADRELEREAERLESLLRLAAEETVMQGRDLGLRFYPDRYEFSILEEMLDPKTGEIREVWRELGNDEILRARELPRDTEIELLIEERAVVLKPARRRRPDDEYRPQVFILSSGDMSPFTLRLRRRPERRSWVLEAGANGNLELTREQA